MSMSMSMSKSGPRMALSLLALFFIALLGTMGVRLWPELTRPKHVDLAFRRPAPLELASLPIAARFDYPLGSEHGALAYNAQRFTENHHLGDDLNGIGGEKSALRGPIFAGGGGGGFFGRGGGGGGGE